MTPLKKSLLKYIESDVEIRDDCELCKDIVSDSCDDCIEYVEWNIDNGGSNAIINHFKVNREYRRQNRGSRVLSEIEEGLKKLNFTALSINMRGGDKTVKFLQEMDYEIIKRENGGNYIIAKKDL